MKSWVVLFLHLEVLAISVLPSSPGVCPSEADRKILFPTSPEPVLPFDCGQGNWMELVNIDTTNESQSCPSHWVLVDSPHRLCAAPESETLSRQIYPVNFSYSRVCGRITGFVVGSALAFGSRLGFDGVVVNAVVGGSLVPVWVFAAGSNNGSQGSISRCPCDNSNITEAPLSRVGDPHFCDEPINGFLWDGQDCISPPVFVANLTSSTDGDLSLLIGKDFLMGTRVFIQKATIFVHQEF